MLVAMQPDTWSRPAKRIPVHGPDGRVIGELAVHRVVDGLCAGGIRRYMYPSFDEAKADAQRLAAAMTAKLALAGVPCGGAKLVLHAGRIADTAAAYEAVGDVVEAEGGSYLCGPDLGTGGTELAVVRSRTSYVNPAPNDPNASTAAGVLAAMRGALQALDGDASFNGRTFLVQGLGGVGHQVALGLSAGGGTVQVADPSPSAHNAADERDWERIDADEWSATTADVLVPCAIGGLINEAVAQELEVKVICGSANNQLASSEAGHILHARGVLFVPDAVASAGAAVEGVLTHRHGDDEGVRRRVDEAIGGIQPRVAELLGDAGADGQDPTSLAWAKARELVP